MTQYYISLLSGMRNIDDRDHLVGQLTNVTRTFSNALASLDQVGDM